MKIDSFESDPDEIIENINNEDSVYSFDPELEENENVSRETYEKKESFISKLFKTKSPDKPLSDYENSPVNYNNSESISRILRGLEGFAINTSLAIIDIVIGGLQFLSGFRNEE